MNSDPHVRQLLEEILDTERTPEEVCQDCPELLPRVRERLRRLRAMEAQVDALFPSQGSDPRPPEPPDAEPPQFADYEALASLERARQVAADLVAAHPEQLNYQVDLAAAYAELGELQGAMARLAEASASFDKAIAIRRRLVESSPKAPLYRSDLAVMLVRRGVAMQKCGRPAEAASAFRQAIAVLRELTNPPWGDLYNMACAQSLLSGVAPAAGSGPTASDGRAAADAAMDSLRRAVAAGWHDPAKMRTDPDLDPIRSRPDFRLLLDDLAFPADPFARAGPARPD